MGAKGNSLDRQAGNRPWNALSPAGRPWAGRHLPQNARLPLPTRGARVRTMTKKKKMVWEAERPLPTGKILVAQLHRPGCLPCARHVGMMKLARGDDEIGEIPVLSLKEQEGHEEGDGWRSGVFLSGGKAAGCPGVEGGMGGAEPLIRRALRGSERDTVQQGRGSARYRVTDN